jgi:hypothetical protein
LNYGTWFYSLENATSLEKWLCSSRNQVIEEFVFVFPKEMVVCFKKKSSCWGILVYIPQGNGCVPLKNPTM